MAQIDWNKVVEDYKDSTFNRERLYLYAKKAAEALKAKGIPFDGYTDRDWQEPPKPQPEKGLLAGLRLFFSPEPPDTRPPLVREHIGYWVLETGVEESHHGHRYSESYLTKSYRFKVKRTNVFTAQAVVRETKWVLLEDGGLAVFATKKVYNGFPYIENFNWIKDDGSVALRNWRTGDGSTALSLNTQEGNFTSELRNMTDEDIFLLDHKKREIRRRYIQRDDYSVEDSSCIRMNNYLLTGKKGGGCSKKITALLKKHDL